MGICDGFHLCEADSRELVVLATAIAGILSNGLSISEIEILIRLLAVIIKCLDSIKDIDAIQDIGCKEDEEGR